MLASEGVPSPGPGPKLREEEEDTGEPEDAMLELCSKAFICCWMKEGLFGGLSSEAITGRQGKKGDETAATEGRMIPPPAAEGFASRDAKDMDDGEDEEAEA